MKKKKGFMLVAVLVFLVVVIIISIPVVRGLVQNSNIKAVNVSEEKADEIAYAGYKVMENYVVNETTAFENETKAFGNAQSIENNNILKTKLDIPYNFYSVEDATNSTVSSGTRETHVTTTINRDPASDKIASVTITSTTDFSEVDGFFEDTIYFDLGGAIVDSGGSNLFNKNDFTDHDEDIDGDEESGSVDNALDRISPDTEIPVGGMNDEEHSRVINEKGTSIDIDIVKDKDDTGQGLWGTGGNQIYVTTDKIEKMVKLLENVVNKTDSKYYIVNVYSSKNAAGTSATPPQLLFDRDLTIDISSLATESYPRPVLVFNMCGNVEGGIKFDQGISLTLSGGDFVVLSNQIEQLKAFNIIQGNQPDTNIPYQVTIGSTDDKVQNEIQLLGGNDGVVMKDFFLYLPNLPVKLGGSWGKPVEITGGLIVKEIQYIKGWGEEKPIFLPNGTDAPLEVQWQGDDWLFGYY